MKNYLFIAIISLIVGCTSLPSERREFLDSSTHTDNAPSWVTNLKSVWDEAGKINLKSSYTLRGDERVNGCFDLARLEAKEALLSEIANDVRGRLDQAQESLSENAELVLGKVRSGEFSGRIVGLRFTESYFERYRIKDTERIDCHVLSEIKQSDYARVKREVIDRVVSVDARLKEAIREKHIEFFTPKERQISQQ